MNQNSLLKKTVLSLFITICLCYVQAQDIQGTQMVGMLSFSTNHYKDSVAAKNIYAAVTRVLIQTKRFTVLEMDKWKLTQDEIERQRQAGFIETDIIKQGKSLGARVLIVGFVKNAELYQDAGRYSARVDFELKYVDVETGKSIAAAAFSGDSENFNTTGARLASGLKQSLNNMFYASSKNKKTVALTSAALGVMSETDKSAINGKIIDAIEESVTDVNTWVHNTFNFSLLFLQAMDEDKKKGFQSVLIEGGEDVGMKKGFRLKMVLVTEIETSKGKIRDEEPVAELEVAEVRAATSKCKVTKGSKRVQEVAQNKNMRIVFDSN